MRIKAQNIILWSVLLIAIIVAAIGIKKALDYNSVPSKNARILEKNLCSNFTSDDSEVTGKVKNLISVDYDKMIVFSPYQPVESMEKQIGFKYSKLKESISEGMNNIIFIKDNSVVAYIYGYPESKGYYLDVAAGEYTKNQLDNMEYKRQKKQQASNSSDTSKIVMHYKFNN